MFKKKWQENRKGGCQLQLKNPAQTWSPSKQASENQWSRLSLWCSVPLTDAWLSHEAWMARFSGEIRSASCWQQYWMLSKRESQPRKAKAWVHVHSRGFTPPGGYSTNTSCSSSMFTLYHVSICGRLASCASPVGSYPSLLAQAKHLSCTMNWTWFARRSSSIARLYRRIWPPDTESSVGTLCPCFISAVFCFYCVRLFF